MAKGEKQDENIKEAPQKGKGGAVKWIIVGMIVLVIIGAAAAGAFYFLPQMTGAQGVKKEQPAIAWTLEPFIVNLADGDRYLKIVMQFEVHDPALPHELDMVKPRIRDAILDLLCSKSQADLVDPAGKQKLREEIIVQVNMALTTGKIAKVYFTDFVIQ
jgi:flagellar FliL protein